MNDRCLDTMWFNDKEFQCEREWGHEAEGGDPINWHRNGTLIWNTPIRQYADLSTPVPIVDLDEWTHSEKRKIVTDTPRVAHSMDDLRVGQVVSYVDHNDQRNDGLFKVAYIDPPEAILKDLHKGWPRIKWQISDFKLDHIELIVLSEQFATINCCEHCPLEDAP